MTTTLTLGRTGLVITKDAFGVLPLQRVSKAEAAQILGKALDTGINFIDAARTYTDSEERIAEALAHRRSEFFLATKTMAKGPAAFWKDLDTSLKTLRTDYIDVYQLHDPSVLPQPEDGSGLYEAMQMAQHQGKIRFNGVACRRLSLAEAAAESGLYDTLQFPFNDPFDERERALIGRCAEQNIGFMAMKALSGGSLADVLTARTLMAGFDKAAMIWGIQNMQELDLLIASMRRSEEARAETVRAEGFH
jgi:aryl-alcohol dehydrogenase-like predicted oxidoreductase